MRDPYLYDDVAVLRNKLCLVGNPWSILIRLIL